MREGEEAIGGMRKALVPLASSTTPRATRRSAEPSRTGRRTSRSDRGSSPRTTAASTQKPTLSMQPPSLFALLFGQRSSPLPPLAAVTPLYTNQPPGHEGVTPAGVRGSHTLNSGLPRCTGQFRDTMLVGVVVLLLLLLLFFVRRTPLPSHTPGTILDSVLPLRTPIRADSNSSRNPRHPRPPPPAAREEALSHEDSHALTTRPDRRASEREGGCSYSTSRPPEPGSQGERAGNHRRCRVRFEIVGKLRAAH